MAKKPASVKTQKMITDIAVHIFLAIVAVVWLIPFIWLVAHSFRAESTGQFTPGFSPKEYTIMNYVKLFTETDSMNFPRTFMNTFIIACFACVVSTFFVLAVSYCLSRVQWKLRKSYMNMGMVITLFPGFMGMVAVYFLLKAMGLTEGDKLPLALIICYTSGAGVGFHIMKGYMDTIPKALDEAAMIDGATRWQTFTKITLPLCKPMIVYQIITSFMGPWMDFILAKVIVRAEAEYYTVSIGLYKMLEMEFVNNWFTRFCAGAVVVAIPISILFMITQKCYQEAMGGAVKGVAHAAVCAAELDIQIAVADLAAGGAKTERGEENGEGVYKGDLAGGGKTGGGGYHIALGNTHVEKALRMGLAEDGGLGGAGEVGVQNNDIGIGLAQFLEDGTVNFSYCFCHYTLPPSSSIALA